MRALIERLSLTFTANGKENFESKSFKVLSTLRQRSNFITTVGLLSCHTEFKITTTATATGTSLNKRFNEQNNGSARAL